jgi:hypothetical protein
MIEMENGSLILFASVETKARDDDLLVSTEIKDWQRQVERVEYAQEASLGDKWVIDEYLEIDVDYAIAIRCFRMHGALASVSESSGEKVTNDGKARARVSTVICRSDKQESVTELGDGVPNVIDSTDINRTLRRKGSRIHMTGIRHKISPFPLLCKGYEHSF